MRQAKTKQRWIDLAPRRQKRKDETFKEAAFFRVSKAQNYFLHKRQQLGGRFFTEDSKLYVTPREAARLARGIKLARETGRWDALSARIVKNYQIMGPSRKANDFLLEKLAAQKIHLDELLKNTQQNFWGQSSLLKAWNISIVGAILFGMFTMTMVYQTLGERVAAEVVTNEAGPPALERIATEDNLATGNLLAVNVLRQLEGEQQVEFEAKARQMVKGYPIEKMLPEIFKQDRTVAAFILSIAKKESNWGRHVPVLDSQDCYNYWGYRGQRKLMGSGGHTCFNSRKDAVDTVAKRIKKLVQEMGLDTPEKLIIWKCGNSCASHGSADVAKWIADVEMYYTKLNGEE